MIEAVVTLAIVLCVFILMFVMMNIERGKGIVQTVMLLLIIIALPVVPNRVASKLSQKSEYANTSITRAIPTKSIETGNGVKPTPRVKQTRIISQTNAPTAKPTSIPTPRPTAKPTSIPTPCPTAHKGESGSVVELIQVRLTDLGYDLGNIDGIYGAKTASAVKSFQERNNLSTTGDVDESTYEAIFSETAKRYILYTSGTNENKTKSGPTNEDYRDAAKKERSMC